MSLRTRRVPTAIAGLIGCAALVTSCANGSTPLTNDVPANTEPASYPFGMTSSNSTSPTTTPTPTVNATPSVAPTAASPTNTTNYVSGAFTITSDEGITIDAELDLSAPTRVSSAQTTWTQRTSETSIPCVTDSQTDAVILGTLRFTNQTPNYTPNFYINFNGIDTGGIYALGAGYSNGGQCITDGSDAWEGSAIQPNWTSTTWQAPIALVIHNDIGPNHPNGDPGNLGPLELVINSQSGDQYNVTNESGLVTELNGPVLQVQLQNLGH